MSSYIIRRLLLMIPTIFCVTLIVYIICRTVPDNPVDKAVNQQMMAHLRQEGGQKNQSQAENINRGQLSKEERKELMAAMGLSDNILKDYFTWLGKIMRGDLGESYEHNESVLKLIVRRMPISIFYGLLSMFFIYAVCIPLGIVKALHHESPLDNVSSILIFIGYAIPGYALGALLVVFAASNLGWFPIGGFVSDNFEQLSFTEKVFNLIHHSILPMSCYLIGSFAFMSMLVKNTMMENLSADYIRTALAKGVSYKRAVFRHALDNSLIPLATNFGNNISLIIGGSFLIEKIFDIDGLGLFGFQAIESRDIPVVMGIATISCLLQIFGNLLSDICVAYVDPRVKFE